MKRIRLTLLFIALVLIMPNVYAAEIKTGTYKFYYGNDESKILVEKNGNIELGDSNSTGTTTWDVYSDGNYFYIRSSSNNSISLTSEGVSNGMNVMTSTTNTSNYQKWRFVQADSRYYYIQSAFGSFNVDVKSGSKELGRNIHLWQQNGALAQKWRVERIDDKQQVLENGTYTIKASNNQNNSIDLSGANPSSGRNIQMYQRNFTWAQTWTLNYENGYYTITTKLANDKAFDVAGGYFRNNSNLQLYQSNGTAAQKWILIPNNDGTYSISTHDGLWRLDISGGSNLSGANLQIYTGNGTPAQKFVFEKTDIEYIPDGYYTINSLVGTDMVVGINNTKAVNNKNVQLTKNNDFRYTKWYIKRIDKEIYTIANAQNKTKVLDVASGSTANNANVQLYQYNGTVAQQWIIRKNPDNTYRIIGVGSQKSLDISGGRSTEGTNIQIYTPNDANAQKFSLTPVTQADYELPDVDSKYVIKSSLDQGKVIDVKGGSKDNNTNIHVWEVNNTQAQVWKLEYVGEGKYVIRSLINPKIVLTANSSNVVIRKYNGSDDQKWYFYRDNNNKMTIYNMGQGKYLQLEGTANRSNVSLSDTQSNKNEIELVEFNQEIKYRGIDVSSHNGDIDWAGIKDKVDFVVIRAGYSSEVIENGNDRYQDSKFLRNVQQCEQYNIPYALYLYSYAWNINGPENSAESEAAHMISLANKAKAYGGPNLKVPVYYDIEDEEYTFKRIGYNGSTFTSMNDRFCSIVESNGYQCGIYTFLYAFDYMGYNNVRNLASKYGMWVAHVKWYNFDPYEDQFAVMNNTDNRYNKSAFQDRYGIKEEMWQYSHQGNIPGANTGAGRIDLNLGYNIFG